MSTNSLLHQDQTFAAADLARWCDGQWSAPPPVTITGIRHDSRAIEPGQLYIALPGNTVDGHSFVAAAFAKGAAAAMVDATWQVPASCAGKPLLRVTATLAALGRLGHAYRQLVDPFMIGVTGSIGKSTIKTWAAALLATTYPAAATKGNYNTDVGLPLSLLEMAPQTRMGVFELGMSHPGEIAPLADLLLPDAAIMGAIAPVHLENFDSLAAIAAEKATLLQAIPASGFAVLDGDSPWSAELQAACRCRIVTISLNGMPADYSADAIDARCGSFTLQAAGARQPLAFKLNLPGRHMVYNAMLALAAARECKVPWEQIAAALTRLPRQKMRWETHRLHGVTLINDAYNASPIAMEAAIESFAATASGRRILLLGEMYELGPASAAFHHSVGERVAASRADVLIAVGPGTRPLVEGALESGFSGALFEATNAKEAGRILLEVLRPGDSILAKGSRGVALEEALAIWLTAKGAGTPA